MPKNYLDADLVIAYLIELQNNRRKEADNFAEDRMYDKSYDWQCRAKGLSSVIERVESMSFQIEDPKPIADELIEDSAQMVLNFINAEAAKWDDKYWQAVGNSPEEHDALKRRRSFETVAGLIEKNFPRNAHGVRKYKNA